MIFNLMDNKDESKIQNHSDFSIDHILNRAGTKIIKSESDDNCDNRNHYENFSWLQCTRYCPPKIPRNHKRDGPQKRQLGRHPRIPFTTYQLSILEQKFQSSPYLSSEEVIRLSQQLDLADIRVKIWFQNRRARERREKMNVKTESCDSATATQEYSPEHSTDNIRSNSSVFWIPFTGQSVAVPHTSPKQS